MSAHPLRSLIHRSHAATDREWRPLADGAEAAVLRHATVGGNGVPRLTAMGAALVLAEVDAALRRARPARAAVVSAAQVEAARLGGSDGDA